jgi:hypothetical protein
MQSFTEIVKAIDHAGNLDILKWIVKELLCRLVVWLRIGSGDRLLLTW